MQADPTTGITGTTDTNSVTRVTSSGSDVLNRLSSILRGTTKCSEQKKLSFSATSTLRTFYPYYHKDSVIETKVKHEQHSFLTLMFSFVDQTFSPREIFFLTNSPSNPSLEKIIVPLPQKDN